MNVQVRPRAISLALWLNAWRANLVSRTDTVNALESITNSFHVQIDSEEVSWVQFLDIVDFDPQSVSVALPREGDPQGLPIHVLGSMNMKSGAVALSSDSLLFEDTHQTWNVIKDNHRVHHISVSHARTNFTTYLTHAQSVLSAADLAGDRTIIDDALRNHEIFDVPAQLPTRLTEALTTAERVRLVAGMATDASVSFASPSRDDHKLSVLKEIDRHARDLMIAVAGHSFIM